MQNYDPQQDIIPASPEPQRPVPGTAKAFSIVAFVCGICSLVTLFAGIQFEEGYENLLKWLSN